MSGEVGVGSVEDRAGGFNAIVIVCARQADASSEDAYAFRLLPGGRLHFVVDVVNHLAHGVERGVRTIDAGAAHLLMPVLASLDRGAALLSVGSVLAVFRWKIGVLPLLGGAALAGVLLHQVLR